MWVPIARHLQLQLPCWNKPSDAVLDRAEAPALCEAGWLHVDEAALTVG